MGRPTEKPANFVLFPPGRPALGVVDELGKRLDTDQMLSCVNAQVELRGREAGNTFRLIEMRKLNPGGRPAAFFCGPHLGWAGV